MSFREILLVAGLLGGGYYGYENYYVSVPMQEESLDLAKASVDMPEGIETVSRQLPGMTMELKGYRDANIALAAFALKGPMLEAGGNFMEQFSQRQLEEALPPEGWELKQQKEVSVQGRPGFYMEYRSPDKAMQLRALQQGDSGVIQMAIYTDKARHRRLAGKFMESLRYRQ